MSLANIILSSDTDQSEDKLTTYAVSNGNIFDAAVIHILLLSISIIINIIYIYYQQIHSYLSHVILNRNLGLSGAKRFFKHAVLDTNKFKDYQEYYKSLGRSSKCYLKRCDNLMKRNNIISTEINAKKWKFTLNHFNVIFDHQKRLLSLTMLKELNQLTVSSKSIESKDLKDDDINVINISVIIAKVKWFALICILHCRALISTFIRSLYLILMNKGIMIEYYVEMVDNGHTQYGSNESNDLDNDTMKRRLIAIGQLIGKGSTLRAMWFYQNSEYCKCNLWFHCLKRGIMETFDNKCFRYIDIGASKSETIAENKTRFGFENTHQWNSICDYNGEYCLG